MAKYKKLSLASRGLKYKLRTAVSLMSLLPLLVSLYLVVNYVIPRSGFTFDAGVVIGISALIAGFGYFLIKEVFDRFLSVSSTAKQIAAGDLDVAIELSREDEVGDLGRALNQLTQRIRDHMDELKTYGEKTSEINIGIQRRVLVLSNLLQINSLIVQGSNLEELLKLIVEKSRFLANSDVAYLLFREHDTEVFQMKIIDGINAHYLLDIKIAPEKSFFNKLIKTNKPFILDKENILPQEISEAFFEKFQLKNTLAMPIYLRGKVTAILGIGNNKDSFLYNKDDLELLDIFAKQVAVATENDFLMQRVKELEINDPLTGLYNEGFIRNRLKEEIRRAAMYQRPCAFILFQIDNFRKFQESFGSLQAESSLKKIASLIKDSVTEIDRVSRFSDNEFALVLPERTKRQAKEIADDIRKKIESSFRQEHEMTNRLTVSGAVSENPLDGTEAAELISKAKELLKVAEKQGKNQIVI